MYFFVSSHFLLQKLHTLYKIVNSENSSSRYLIFEIIENQLKIIAFSDSENIINTSIKVYAKKYTKEKVVVSTKFMIDILTTFPNETLLFKKKKNALNIFSEQGSYKIPIFFHEESIDFFQKKRSILRSSTMKITLFSNLLSKILNQTLFAVGDKKFQTILNGVFFKFSPYEANFVATDTFRLVKYTIKNLKFDKSIEFTIPKKSLDIIRKILKEEKKSNVIIEYNNEIDIVFHFQNHIFSCRLINEKYPDYNSVIPNNNRDVSLVINRLLLLNTIRRISIFSKNRKNFIRFHLNHNKLKIREQTSVNNDNFESEIQCKPIFDDLKKTKSIKMGFNSKFLIEILSSLNENFICFELYHSNKIGILKPFSNEESKKEESISILIMSTI
ncbi:DNA polymerase III subunit beta [Blattabacterium cuenoti]|uniref:DNA polymerase III subunit beta n=1 Tax=Blattabacterium cuenoti TaxID=1653831 RepID=UPI00163C4CA9|nr:DNA polymerase III subunit beta [Blattabacterium cuenoti]